MPQLQLANRRKVLKVLSLLYVKYKTLQQRAFQDIFGEQRRSKVYSTAVTSRYIRDGTNRLTVNEMNNKK